MFIEADPSSHFLQISAIVFGEADVGFEEIGEGVKRGRHRIDDDMRCFVKQQSGFFIVGEVMRQT